MQCACIGYVASPSVLYRTTLIKESGTLVLTKIKLDEPRWYIRGLAPFLNGLAITDSASKQVLALEGAKQKTTTVVAGHAANNSMHNGPAGGAAFCMPTCVVTNGRALFVSDCDHVRLIGGRSVKTLQTVRGHITAMAPTGLGRYVIAVGTMQGCVGIVSRSLNRMMATLPGPVDALVVTTTHTALATVAMRQSALATIYTVHLLTGASTAVKTFNKRTFCRPNMLTWCGNDLVAFGRDVLLVSSLARGKPVLHSHNINWRARSSWSTKSRRAAVATVMCMRRREALPPELVNVVLHWLFITWF